MPLPQLLGSEACPGLVGPDSLGTSGEDDLEIGGGDAEMLRGDLEQLFDCLVWVLRVAAYM